MDTKPWLAQRVVVCWLVVGRAVCVAVRTVVAPESVFPLGRGVYSYLYLYLERPGYYRGHIYWCTSATMVHMQLAPSGVRGASSARTWPLCTAGTAYTLGNVLAPPAFRSELWESIVEPLCSVREGVERLRPPRFFCSVLVGRNAIGPCPSASIPPLLCYHIRLVRC